MITLEDCIALCGLNIDEVDAIAEHEHIPEINAAALAQYLLSRKTGTKKIRDMKGDVSNIPIIAVTAKSSMKDRGNCLSAGMNDYIAKPINVQFLKMIIDEWLAEKH